MPKHWPITTEERVRRQLVRQEFSAEWRDYLDHSPRRGYRRGGGSSSFDRSELGQIEAEIHNADRERRSENKPITTDDLERLGIDVEIIE